MVGRQGRDAEDGDPPGKAHPFGQAPLQPGKGFLPARRPVSGSASRREPPPEGCLPVALLARFPAEHHVGPVDEILVEKAGDVPAELVALEAPAVIGKVFLQGLEAFPVQAAGQQTHDSPGEHFRVEGPRAGQIGQNGEKELLNEVVGEGETDVGADPEAPGHLQGEPPLHAAALDQDDLRDRGRGQRLPQGLRKLPGEGLETVAGV